MQTTGRLTRPASSASIYLGAAPSRRLRSAAPTQRWAKGSGLREQPVFGNAGMYQNQLEYGTTLNWVKGRHTMSFGAQIDQAQFNILNNNTNTDTIDFTSFVNFA